MADPPAGGVVLDLCAGTGEVSALLAEHMSGGRVVGLDFSPQMLERAREKYSAPNLDFLLGDAMEIDYPDNSFDSVLIAFALRNVEDIPRVLSEMRRVVKKDGRVLCLDLGRPSGFIFPALYYCYFNYLLPLLGRLLHGEGEPYSYLTSSLKTFPTQEALKESFLQAGFRDVYYRDLSGGIVAIHSGRK